MITLTQQEKDILHFKTGSRKISFRYDLLNFDEVEIGELSALSGRLGLNSLSQIKRRGRFEFRENEISEVDWLNDRVRPVLILDDTYEYNLGIFLMSSPTRKLKNNGIYREVEAYDSSLILLEDKFDTRYKISKDTTYTSAINQILVGAGVLKTKINKSESQIKTDKEFEVGTSKLEVVNTLLQEINYTSLWVDEIGYFRASPYVLPSDRVTEYTYKNNEISVIHSDGSTEEIDFFNVPNRWVITVSNPESVNLISTFTNNNGLSPTSAISRRRTITDFRILDGIADQATLDNYVKRIAYEASNVYGKFVFSTALMPHHSYMDALFCEHTGLGISHKYIETSWEMDLTEGGKMDHNCRRVIQI